MDKIAHFDIHLDTSNTHKTYNYGICKLSTTIVDTFWTPLQWLDNIFTATDNPSEHSFDNSYKRHVAFFRPGDRIKGHVILRLHAPLKVASIRIACQGKASYHQIGSMQEDTLSQEINLWHSSINEAQGLLDGGNSWGNQTRGEYTFPFEFTLPTSIIGSMPNLIFTKAKSGKLQDHAYNLYRLKATIYQTDPTQADDKRVDTVIFKPFWLDEVLLSNYNDQQVEESGAFKLGNPFGSSFIKYKVSIPKQLFARTDTIPLDISIENNSDYDIQNISAYVALKISIGRTESFKKPTIKRLSLGVDGNSIPSHSSSQMSLHVPLDFRWTLIDTNLLPASSTRKSQVFEKVSYKLIVNLHRDVVLEKYRRLCIEIPLTVGSW